MSLKRTHVLSLLDPSDGLGHSSDGTASNLWSHRPFFPTQSLSKFLFQKHFSELDMNGAGRHSKLSLLVFAANVPLGLEKRVRTSVGTAFARFLDLSSRLTTCGLEKVQKTHSPKGGKDIWVYILIGHWPGVPQVT